MLRMIVMRYMAKLNIYSLDDLLALMNYESDFNYVKQHLSQVLNETECNFNYLNRLEEVLGIETGLLAGFFRK